MKVLKIENKKCFYSIDGENYNPIVDIGKDDIYMILRLLYDGKAKMDEYNDDVIINNEVEKLIYKDLYVQISYFEQNIPLLKQEINDEFKDAFEKYNVG